MNREFIEDAGGMVACIVPSKRIVKVGYYFCGFCQTEFDCDDPKLILSPNDGRVRCPNDNTRLEREYADIEVG